MSKIGILVRMYFFFFFQAEDGIRDAQESRGLGDVYKRQVLMMVRDRVAAWTREKDRCISAPLRPVLGAPSVRSRTAFWIIEGVVEEEEEEEDCMPVGGVVALAALACLTTQSNACLLYTSDAADEEDSVDLGGRRIIKKKKIKERREWDVSTVSGV
eukprot:TRINITY_DN8910_c0_g1_i1.p1 TRINITY_DN8910_c0_g1~~TRINITY_DN8910_c0_g1_i1.p1  ORF type:complete len:157 (+),score=47.29 TRINITY_DN8910_c0_g1_i1:58-528(+)